MAPSTSRQPPPGLREDVRQGSVAGPKEGGLGLPCVCGTVDRASWQCDRVVPPTQPSSCQTVESKRGVLPAQTPADVVPSCPPTPVPPLPLDPCFPTDFGIVLVCNNPLSLSYQKDLKNSNTQSVNTCPAHRHTAFHRPSTGVCVCTSTHIRNEKPILCSGPKPWEGVPSASLPSVPRSLVQ